MSRRSNTAARCATCMMHESVCVCALFVPIPTRTKLVLLIHHTEVRKPTNTGHLAVRSLPNSTMIVRGKDETPTAPIDFGDTEPVFLYPHEDARPVEPVSHPVTLIVPDGNWRQAGKVRARVAGLSKVRCVTLPPGPPTIYRLRSEQHPAGLATLEAIARAMAVLEGPHVHDALMHLFRIMVERTLWVRGSLPASEVTGGIPPGVTKHEPTSGVRPAT